MGSPIRRGRAARRAFTLLEALMAAGILLTVVLSVTTAITAGQQHAYEAHQRIAGALAAEELLGRITTGSYASLPTWHGHTEAVGAMTDINGNPMPDSFAMIGRNVQVTTTMQMLPDLGVQVRGRVVCVRAFNEQGRILAEISHFVAEPQS